RMSSVVLLRRPLRSSLFPYTTLFRSLADELQQAGQLARIGDHVEWPVLQQPLRAAAEESLGRGADVGNLQCAVGGQDHVADAFRDRKSTRLNSSHVKISYAVFCLNTK